MKLTVNGQIMEFDANAHTVESLLESLEMGGKPVVVELNQDAVFPADYPSTAVTDGAQIEIVTIAAGG
ncbi:MAG: thiamine biosynthesis protein ThiS [Akkermansiaceae bacterium]|nr:thiamine biosynthesis protein ThiS [Akkermansiaceae bacterium]